jgi:hypothetical protein
VADRARTFNSSGSPRYRAAVATLEDLARAEGVDIAHRAFAEVAWARHRDAWANVLDLRPSTRDASCWCLLTTQRCTTVRGLHSPVGWGDHGSLWTFDGRPVVYVGQPYGLDAGGRAELDAVCAAHGLEYFLDARPGWHFPGAVLTVEVWRRGERGRIFSEVRARRAGATPP